MGGQNNYQALLDQGYTSAGPAVYTGNTYGSNNPQEWIRQESMTPNPPMGLGSWQMPMTNPDGQSVNANYSLQPTDAWGYNSMGQPTLLSGNYGNGRGKTTEELAAEEAARQAAIAQRKSEYDAQMNNQFMGNFDFLNQPMEVSPFRLQGGQAIMGRPTYNGQPPQTGGNTMSSAFSSRGAQVVPGQQPQQPAQDLGQLYSLFQNPYLAELATMLFKDSSWLK